MDCTKHTERKTRSGPGPAARRLLGLTLAVLFAAASPGVAQEAGPTADTIEAIESDELRVRLAPLTLDALEAVREELLQRLRAEATELADAIVEQMTLRDSTDADPAALAAGDERVTALVLRKNSLASKAGVLLDAIATKGGDVAASRGYLTALDALHRTDAPAPAVPEAAATDAEADASEAVRRRAAELVAIVRSEPPVHERAIPWDIPPAELELEYQPLAVKEILARLEKWREILERELRKRVRIDILLNDGKKLEAAREERRAAAAQSGAAGPDVTLEALKSELAEQSQEQQRIINAIVERMEAVIVLVERRGGDASEIASYVAAATGQRLNLTDPTILRAQVFAWLRSPDGGVAIGLNLLKFIVIVFIFWVFSRILGRLTSAGVRRMPRASSLLRPVLSGAVRKLTLFVGIVIGVSMLGVNIGPLLAMIGAAGLVIGLALQGTLSNFASGILILLNRPYDVGDAIEAGGVSGKVEAMNLVSTSVLTFDNKLMLVPNNEIWSGVITNVNGKSTRRVDLKFGIGYGDDMDQAIEIIRGAIVAHPKVLAEPAPTIRVHELGDNSVNLIARPWAATSDYWEVFWDVMFEVKKRFDAEGVNIPYPQRDLHVPGPIEVRVLTGDA